MANFIGLCLVLLFSVTVYQTDAEWTVLDVIEVSTLTNQPGYIPSLLLAPDGASLAWVEPENQVCLFDLKVKLELCRALPIGLPLDLFAWSPDSQYLLLRDGIGEFTSAYAYSFQTGDYQMLEDAQYFSDPIWDAEDAVYYLDYEYEDGIDKTFLNRFAMNSGDLTTFDLNTILELSFGYNQLISLQSNGTKLLVLVELSFSGDVEPGLWLIDTADASAEHLLPLQDLYMGLPSDEVRIRHTIWNSEQNQVVVVITSSYVPYSTFAVNRIDVDARTVTPLLKPNESSYSGGYVTPDGEFFFYYTTDETQHKIFAVPLTTPTSEPILVSEAYQMDCLPTSLLITLGRENETKRYLYEPAQFCPG